LDISYIDQKYLTPCTLWREKREEKQGGERNKREWEEEGWERGEKWRIGRTKPFSVCYGCLAV